MRIHGAANVLQTAHGISSIVELLQPGKTLALHHDYFTADRIFHDLFVEALNLIATRVSHCRRPNFQLGIPPPALLMPGHVYISVWRCIEEAMCVNVLLNTFLSAISHAH